MITRMSVLAALFACASMSAAAEDAAVTRARALGSEIAHVFARTQAGDTLDLADADRLQRALMEASRDVDPSSEAGAKLQATARALSVLRHYAGTSSRPSKQNRATRDQYILERVVAGHGSTCDNAMGLSLDKPSRLTLGTGSDAWFYASTKTATTMRIATQSQGPDPVLEIFAGCSSNATPIGTNDDSFGLDAALTTAVDDHQTVFVHVTNRGEGGELNVVLSATTATITGKVVDSQSGKPIPSGALVEMFSTDNVFQGRVSTDENGNYTITPGSTGSFYIGAAAQGHVTQVYPTGNCAYGISDFLSSNVCDLSHAKLINVPASGTVPNINFSLSPGARISGQVRSTSNDPLPANVQLSGENVSFEALNSIFADGAGHFAFPALPPGTYQVQVRYGGYLSQMWNHIDCPVQFSQDCDISKATPIVVGSSDIPDIDFTLQPAASIHGTVTAPGQNYSSYVYILDQNGSSVSEASTDTAGHYVSAGLPLGTYYVSAGANNYFQQLYNMLDCPASCSSQLANATPLTISSNGQQLEADFVLTPYPSLRGHITEATSGTPLPNTTVLLTMSPNSGGYITGSAVTDASGAYVVPAVPPATFYAWAQSPDHVDEIYDGVVCEAPEPYNFAPHCDVSTATPLTSSASGITQSVVDFALRRSSSIAGHIIERAGPGSDLIPLVIQVTLYDGTNVGVASASMDAAGNYLFPDLAPGTYYAIASSTSYSEQYLPQLWQTIDCMNACTPTTGTPISVPSETDVTGIDFQLTRLNGIVGRVVDAHGEPIRGAAVDLFNVSDHSYAGGGGADALGYFAAPVNGSGSYYVATEAGGGYIDQIFSGIACPAGTAYDGKCSFNNATAVNFTSTPTQPVIVNFTLQIGDRVFGNGFE